MAKAKKPVDVMEKFVGGINKSFKHDVARIGTDSLASEPSFWVPTGCRLLDMAVDRYARGLPGGRIIEIYGKESSGKTTFLTQLFIQLHKMGGISVLIDTESSWDKDLAAAMGMDFKNHVPLEPTCPTVEDGFDAVEAALKNVPMLKARKNAPQPPMIIAWDTVSAAVTRNELAGTKYAGGRQEKPRVIKERLLKLVHKIQQSNAMFVMLNQVMADGTPTGPQAIRHVCSVRFEMRSWGRLNDSSGRYTGINCCVKVIKTKLRSHGAKMDGALYFDRGVDDAPAVWNLLLNVGYIVKAGSWFTVPLEADEVLGKGKRKTQVLDHFRVLEIRSVEAGDSSPVEGLQFQGAAKFEHVIAVPEIREALYAKVMESFRYAL